jgi:UDP-glucose 4-epimerase
MKIIVTGGAGFIASHVADAYIAAGHRVIIIDNLATGFRRNMNPKATFYKADIRDLPLMEKIFKKERPEVVNHHAAIAEVVKSIANPLPTYEVNVLGTANVLLAFGKYGRGKDRRFIFSSTGGAIYGEPKKIPADESTPRTPLSPYGLSKALGEDIIWFYAKQYGFTPVIFRYPNVYGPRQNPKGEAGVVAIFGGLLKSGKRPTIFGDGTKARDYTYVGDLVRANLAALKKGGGHILNLGWGVTVSDKTIFEEIARATGYRGVPRYAPYRTGEVYRIALDARKAKRVLGWTPRVKLRAGIRQAIAGIRRER